MTNRRRLISLGVGLSAVVAAASTVSLAVAADPLDPKVKPTKADQVFASSAVLTNADLGAGWLGGPRTPTSRKTPTCSFFHPNNSDLTLTGHAEALYNNGNGGMQVDSDVEVLRSAAQVQTEFKRLIQPPLTKCVRYDLLKSVGGTGVELGFAKRLTFPRLASVTVAYRVVISVKSSGQTVHVLDDQILLGQGRAEGFLNVVAPETNQSQLLAFETRLARAVVKRMSA